MSDELGKLGNFIVDTDEADVSYGMYISVGNGRVFVDIKEDKLKAQREQYAHDLHRHSAELTKSLAVFKKRHPEFANRSADIIGLHNKETRRGEVFWEPTGYTLLREFTFVYE